MTGEAVYSIEKRPLASARQHHVVAYILAAGVACKTRSEIRIYHGNPNASQPLAAEPWGAYEAHNRAVPTAEPRPPVVCWRRLAKTLVNLKNTLNFESWRGPVPREGKSRVQSDSRLAHDEIGAAILSGSLAIFSIPSNRAYVQ